MMKYAASLWDILLDIYNPTWQNMIGSRASTYVARVLESQTRHQLCNCLTQRLRIEGTNSPRKYDHNKPISFIHVPTTHF